MAQALPKKLFIEVNDKRMPNFPISRGMLHEAELEVILFTVKDFIEHHIGKVRYSSYYVKYHICEWLNLANVLFQLVFMDIFLGGLFSEYGVNVWHVSNLDPEDRGDPMNLVFPKVAKCTFRRFGPSGTLQVYDGLCVLPINIFNEKIYIFLWFWFVCLAIVSGISMRYRMVTLSSSKFPFH